MDLIRKHVTSRSGDMFRDHFYQIATEHLCRCCACTEKPNQACDVLLCRSIAIASFVEIIWRIAQERLK